MLRPIKLTLIAVALTADLSLATPAVEVDFVAGVPQIRLVGDYSLSHYTIYRGSGEQGPFAAVTDVNTLCLGSCFVDDHDAVPGTTYWYRFDIVRPDGLFESFGPSAVTIPALGVGRIGAKIFPNPGRGAARVDVFLAGARSEPPVEADLVLHDLQGRRLGTLFRGSLPRGVTSLSWNGHDGEGRAIAPGLYFLSLKSTLGSAIVRVVRTL